MSNYGDEQSPPLSARSGAAAARGQHPLEPRAWISLFLECLNVSCPIVVIIVSYFIPFHSFHTHFITRFTPDSHFSTTTCLTWTVVLAVTVGLRGR